MRLQRYHACRFETARVAAAVPGEILTCGFCGEPARIDEDGWPVSLGWRERRRWRKEQRKVQRLPERGGHSSGNVTVNELPPPPAMFMQRREEQR